MYTEDIAAMTVMMQEYDGLELVTTRYHGTFLDNGIQRLKIVSEGSTYGWSLYEAHGLRCIESRKDAGIREAFLRGRNFSGGD